MTRCSSARAGLAILSVALGTAVGVAGCGAGSADSATSPPSGAPPATTLDSTDVGSVSLDLTIAGGIEIDSVGYDISGGTFHRSGSIDVSKSSAASALIDGVPFATGYAVTMTASSVGTPQVNCSGSASFDVTGPGATGVPVHLICKEVPTTPPPPPPPAPAPVPSPFLLALCAALLASTWALLGRAVPKSAPQGAAAD